MYGLEIFGDPEADQADAYEDQKTSAPSGTPFGVKYAHCAGHLTLPSLQRQESNFVGLEN
jgi:hypothetical protein